MILARFLFAVLFFQYVVADEEDLEYYVPLSEEGVEKLERWSKDDKQPMWELSGQYEGDMVLTPLQLDYLNSYQDDKWNNGAANENLRWPNGEIVYRMAHNFNKEHQHFIESILLTEFNGTCVRIRPHRPADKDYVFITGGKTGCWSHVGRQGGLQLLNLDPRGCLTYKDVVHQFMHVAGFFHQHNSPDRDRFVKIEWKNIIPGQAANFAKLGVFEASDFGERYDYKSIMHPSEYYFSVNGNATIIPTKSNQEVGGKVLTQSDRNKLNKMYKCAPASLASSSTLPASANSTKNFFYYNLKVLQMTA